MKVLFVLPVLSDSYYRKRIEKLRELGVDCTVIGFERNHYEGKPWHIPVKSLGHIEHGHYFKRIGTLLTSIFYIRKALVNKNVVYAYNLDLLLISWFSTLFIQQKVQIVYDVADIRSILVKKGVLPSILRTVERFLLKRTDVVVVASPAYIESYFKNIQHADNNYFVIENKVDNEILSHLEVAEQPVSKKDFMTIGYFGMLRCERSLRILRKLIESSNGQIQLLLRGVFLHSGDYEAEFKKLDYAHYGGPFLYPDDLMEMFKAADLIWAAHYQTKPNKNWAILNRFYQACYFKKPLIVQADTQNEKLVKKYNIGLVIDLANPTEAVKKIQNVNFSQISEWQNNMSSIPERIYTFTDEHKKLIELLKSSKKT